MCPSVCQSRLCWMSCWKLFVKISTVTRNFLSRMRRDDFPWISWKFGVRKGKKSETCTQLVCDSKQQSSNAQLDEILLGITMILHIRTSIICLITSIKRSSLHILPKLSLSVMSMLPNCIQGESENSVKLMWAWLGWWLMYHLFWSD